MANTNGNCVTTPKQRSLLIQDHLHLLSSTQQQIIKTIGNLRWRTPVSSGGLQVGNMSKQHLINTTNYLQDRIDNGQDKVLAHQAPFARSEWVVLLQAELMIRKNMLGTHKANQIIDQAGAILRSHGMLTNTGAQPAPPKKDPTDAPVVIARMRVKSPTDETDPPTQHQYLCVVQEPPSAPAGLRFVKCPITRATQFRLSAGATSGLCLALDQALPPDSGWTPSHALPAPELFVVTYDATGPSPQFLHVADMGEVRLVQELALATVFESQAQAQAALDAVVVLWGHILIPKLFKTQRQNASSEGCDP